jgi:hypothetical protein
LGSIYFYHSKIITAFHCISEDPLSVTQRFEKDIAGHLFFPEANGHTSIRMGNIHCPAVWQ